MEFIQYSLHDFKKVIKNGFEYEFSEDTLIIIKKLAAEVGSPSYVKTPIFNNYKIRNQREGGHENWELLRQFSVTKLVKKNGIEEHIENIQKYLNKLTDKTYSAEREHIFTIIEQIRKIDTNPETFENIGKLIFQIASNNIFFSELYALLYKELIEEFDFMKDILAQNYNNFSVFFQDNPYYDAEKNYEKFCAYNKQNDKIKALCIFYWNLMLLGVLEENKVLSMIKDFQEKLLKIIQEPGKRGEAEGISENLMALLFKSYEYFKGGEHWGPIYKYLQDISNMKLADYPSLSNKIIYKHMDMLEMEGI